MWSDELEKQGVSCNALGVDPSSTTSEYCGGIISAPIIPSESSISLFSLMQLKVLSTKIANCKCCGSEWVDILHTAHIITT